jgi:general secretion pathway protein G
MVDYNEMRRRFKPKDPVAAKKRERSAAAVKRIAREYERKRTELGLDRPVFRRTPVYYMMIVLVMVFIAAAFIGVMTGTLSLGKKQVSKAEIQARKSIDALAQACGRYRFHVGRYPTTQEGLEELAAIRTGLKGWFGPYIKKVVPDPWGNAYVYEEREEGGHPVLYSKGADRRAGTTDDVLPDQRLFDKPFLDTTWTNRWMPYQLLGILVAPDEKTKEAWQVAVQRYE